MPSSRNLNTCSSVIVLPVSRTPIDIPMLDMSPVSRRACLQKGIAHIPHAVTSIENPARQDNQREHALILVEEVLKIRGNCRVKLVDV